MRIARFQISARAASLFIMCAAIVLIASLPGQCANNAQEIKLTILHTNDLHGMLVPFDFDILGKKEENVGGAARRATMIRAIKAASPKSTIVMDAGDVFVRGPMERYEGKPDFEVMNAVPYEIMTLGNNEFKGDQYTGSPSPKGLSILRERIKETRFPIVCANAIDKSTGKTLVPPYVIIERSGIRIGVFGLTAPRVSTYPQAEGVEIKDPIVTAKEMVTELTPKCDFIIALTHIGYPLDLALAGAVPGIGAIIGGDSHTWIPKPTAFKSAKPDGPSWWVGGPIVCQDGEYGKCLGRLDLALRKDRTGHYLVTRFAGKLIDINSATRPAADIERILSGYKP